MGGWDQVEEKHDPNFRFFSGPLPPDIRCVNFICHRGNVFVSRPWGKSRWIPAPAVADGHNGQSWQGLGRMWIINAEARNLSSNLLTRKLFTESFILLNAKAISPFRAQHQTFVSDLLTCQKQHNLRTKCGIIYAEKETSDMKRDKKKKLTG